MAKCIRCKGHLAKADKTLGGKCLICHLDSVKAKKKKTKNPAYEASNFKTYGKSTIKILNEKYKDSIADVILSHPSIKQSITYMELGPFIPKGFYPLPTESLWNPITHPTIRCFSCNSEVKWEIYKETINLCLACALALIHKKAQLFQLSALGEHDCFVIGCSSKATKLRVEHWVLDGNEVKKHIRVCDMHVHLAFEAQYWNQVPGPFEPVESGHQANATEFVRKVDHE